MEGRFLQLNQEKMGHVESQLGYTLLVLPFISMVAGHKYPFNTFRDYVQFKEGSSDPLDVAAGYLHDLIDNKKPLTVKEIIQKWYGQPNLFEDPFRSVNWKKLGWRAFFRDDPGENEAAKFRHDLSLFVGRMRVAAEREWGEDEQTEVRRILQIAAHVLEEHVIGEPL